MVSMYRNQFDIFSDMLKIAGEGATKTRIMYRANMSHKQLKNFLLILEAHNLITLNVLNGTWHTTPHGFEYLVDYRKLMEHLGLLT